MSRWFTLALVAVTLAAGALILATAPQLPARVASHFDWEGRPNGWMDRETYVVVMLAVGVLLPWVVYTATRLVRGIRDAAYWLAPQRRDATQAALQTFGAVTGLALALFGVTMHFAIVAAHAAQPVRLDNGTLFTALVLFVVAVVGIAIAHALRFRRPPDRAMQR